MNWIEINNIEDLPKEDDDKYYWWVNRVSGEVHPDKRKNLLGQSFIHITFSHYIELGFSPEPPTQIKQVDGEFKSWLEAEVGKILHSKQ